MYAPTQNAIAGYFTDRAGAERAVRDLMAAGFSQNDIDLAPYNDAASGQYAGDSTGHTGGLLVTVFGARAQEAGLLLERDGADIGDRVNPALAGEGVQRIQLREEQLRARTQTVQAGEVRVGKDIITEMKTIDVPVTHEELVITRHPVSGATASAGPITAEADIVVPLSREEAILEKTTVVREEVEVGKRAVTETQRLSDTVRHEEAHIENTGDTHVVGDTDHRSEMLDTDAASRRMTSH